VGSHLGVPDAGIASYRDMVERVRTLASLSSVPIICDADTGFGGLLNIQHCVQGYEAAGAAAIQLEDQEFPKKCGHTPGRTVVPLDEAVARIRTAASARTNPDFLIVARTDARTSLGLEEALRRGRAFADAGADVLFIESPETEEELEIIGKRLGDVPLLINVVEGGRTPVLSRERYAQLGFQLAIYPATGFLAMGKALEKVYSTIRDTGSSLECADAVAEFKEFCVTMGFESVWAFDKAAANMQDQLKTKLQSKPIAKL